MYNNLLSNIPTALGGDGKTTWTLNLSKAVTRGASDHIYYSCYQLLCYEYLLN